MKRNLKYPERSNAKFSHHVDPKFRSFKDENKCNGKSTAVRNHIGPIENSCAARLDRIEKIIYDHFDRINTVEENYDFEYATK